MKVDNQRYVQEWEPDFRLNSVQYRDGPVENRPCRNICCLLLFVLILISFIGLGITYIPKARTIMDIRHQVLIGGRANTVKAMYTDLSLHSKQILTIVFLMAILTIILSAVYLFLIKSYPRCMIYSTMAVTAIIFIALAVLLFLSKQTIAGVVVLVLFTVFACCIYCCLRRTMDALVIMLRLTAVFLESNSQLFLTPVIVGVLGLALAGFGVTSLAGVAASFANGTLSRESAQGVSFLHLFYYIFFSYFLYYVMVFLVATSAADWYYQRGSSFCSGLGRLMGAHIGSLTFASIIVSLVKIVQLILESAQRQTDNLLLKCCLCCVQCCISILQGLLETLNHFAIIVMSFTGQDFVDSAKTAGVLVFSHVELFAMLSSVSGFLVFSGILFLTGVPTLFSVLISKQMGVIDWIPVIALLTFFASITIAAIFLSTLSQALTSIYVFFCFDRQLQIYGVRELPRPQNIQPYTYQYLVNNDLSGQAPVNLLTAAYPMVSGNPAAQTNFASVTGAVPLQNTYQQVTTVEVPQVPVQPLYQQYHSGLKTNYGSRDYNAPGYQPTGSGINYQSMPYNDPQQYSQNSSVYGQGRPAVQQQGYPQI